MNSFESVLTSTPSTMGFKFCFIQTKDKITIDVSNQYDTMKYIGSITAHPNIDFGLIQDILQEGQFTVLIRNADILKLKVGPVVVELDCKFKLQTQQLQREIDKLLQNNNELQTSVKKLQKQNQAIKIKVNQTSQILLVEQPIKWSQKLKSNCLQIKKRFVTKKKRSECYQFALLDVNLSQKVERKQSWAIKIKKKADEILLGVCLKNVILNAKFNYPIMKLAESGQGCYAINSEGWTFSRASKKENNAQKGFKFGIGDVVFIEYDPLVGCLHFFLNDLDAMVDMAISDLAFNDTLHPFVALLGENSSVQLMLAGEPTNETWLSRFIRKYLIDI